MRQRRFFIGSRQVGELVTLSARALMVDKPFTSLKAFVKNGTRRILHDSRDLAQHLLEA